MQNAAQEASVEDDELHRIRHSLAHVLAQAVVELRPGATLGFGPAIADGFYYDFVLPEPLSDADLVALEKKMKHIIKQGQKFERQDLAPEEAYRFINDTMHEPYKLEYAKELVQKHGSETISFYKNGPFVDMCEGPHVKSTRELPAGGFDRIAKAAEVGRDLAPSLDDVALEAGTD